MKFVVYWKDRANKKDGTLIIDADWVEVITLDRVPPGRVRMPPAKKEHE